MTDEHEPWAIIYTTWRHSRLRKGKTREEYWAGPERRPYELVVRLPPGSTVSDAVRAWRENQGVTGHSCAGPFQIQGPNGIYWHKKGIRNLGLCKPEQVEFISWDDLEAAEEAGEDPLRTPFSDAQERARAAA